MTVASGFARTDEYACDDDLWRAVSTRDACADGVFVYGVRTTRVYCRPNCKTRLARRANVMYFFPHEIAAAEDDGYRACKRCKPEVDGAMPDDDAVARIRQLVVELEQQDATQEQASEPSELARAARVSRWHFHRKFKEVTGLTPRAYMTQRQREARAKTKAARTVQTPQTHTT